MNDEAIKLNKLKGRPMLHWVGKSTLDMVKSYPAQITHQYGFEKDERTKNQLNFNNLEQDWHHLLLHGDNKEVLSTLLVKGFRGKIDLIYIDPPFDSKADYVKKVELRGVKDKIEGEAQTVIEQTQYTDIWRNDTYLQFMYERLIILRELLSEKGSIYLHCDHHKSHHLRFLLDEVFGAENFVNEIIWKKVTSAKSQSGFFSNVKDTILIYRKNTPIFFPQFVEGKQDEKNYPYIEENTGRAYGTFDFTQDGQGEAKFFGQRKLSPPKGKHWIWRQEKIDEGLKKNLIVFTANGMPRVKRYLDEKAGNYLGDIWEYFEDEYTDLWEDDSIAPLSANSFERIGYPTQKPEALLERIIKASSNEDSIILDCFMGSGTTQAVAQKLGRRWIGCDMNKGAIQTTSKRLQKIMEDQKNDLHDLHITKFCQYKINNYDFQARHNALQIIIEKYGIVPFPTDSFFDGIIKDNLVKILDLTRPCNLIDIQSIREEINSRDNEERHIIIIASGVEITVEEELEKYNKTHPINKLLITNIQSDGIISSEPAETEIKVIKQDNKAKITIDAYFSPTILKKLDIERTLFQEHIKDFRSQIDMVLIDNDYNGEVFNIYHQDIPEKKKDFIDGVYEVPVASPDAKIAIKIIDMLGEETLFIDG